MKTLLITITLLLSVMSAHVKALDLQTAKDNGLVGELPTGYIAAVSTADAATTALINETNAKRKEHFEEISKTNATDIKVVEKSFGEKALEKTKAGHYVQVNNKWVKK